MVYASHIIAVWVGYLVDEFEMRAEAEIQGHPTQHQVVAVVMGCENKVKWAMCRM